MLNLIELLDENAEELARTLAELPDARALVRRLRAVLGGRSDCESWFPVVPMERFLRGMAVIEEYLLARMGWEVEPDPVVRARARSRLRRGLARLARQYAAAMDREAATVRSRLESVQQRLRNEQRLVAGLMAHVQAGVAVLDGAGRVLLWSHAAAALTGVACDDAIGHELEELLPGLGKCIGHHFRAPGRAATSGTVDDGCCRSLFDENGKGVEVTYRLARLPGSGDAGNATWVLAWLPALPPGDSRAPGFAAS